MYRHNISAASNTLSRQSFNVLACEVKTPVRTHWDDRFPCGACASGSSAFCTPPFAMRGGSVRSCACQLVRYFLTLVFITKEGRGSCQVGLVELLHFACWVWPFDRSLWSFASPQVQCGSPASPILVVRQRGSWFVDFLGDDPIFLLIWFLNFC